MYESFYRLSGNPFRLAPDSKFCFSHPCYDEARAYLEFAFKLGEGFVIFTGRPGTGKTTLVQSFLGSLDSTRAIAARIAVTNLNAADLLRAVAYAFDIDVEGLDMASVLRRLERFFVQQVRSGKRILLIIDEAQGLSHSALEELRMLADLQIDSRFLLQVFLVGQEKLRQLMLVPEMEQFQQRVTGTCKLVPLSVQETRDYVEYRLCQVDWSGDPELTGSAVHAVYRYSEGIPRHINKLCTRLLLHGLLEGKHLLDEVDVLGVAEGLKDELLAPLQSDRSLLDANVDARQTARPAEQADDNYAALALSSPKAAVEDKPGMVKPERRVSIEHQVKKTRDSTSGALTRRKEKAGTLQKLFATELYRPGMNRALTVSGYLKRCIEPPALLVMLAIVTLLLVMVVIDGKDSDEYNNPLATREDSYERWLQLNKYRDSQHEELTYEKTGFVGENRARRSALLAAREKDTARSADDSKQAPTAVRSTDIAPIPGLEPVVRVPVVEKGAPAVAKEPDPDDAIRDIAAIEALVDNNMRDDSSIMFARADTFDPAAIAEGKMDTVVPGAGSEQAAAEKERQDEIGRLLSLARESLREYRLLIPEGNNAYEYFQQVEKLDPGNREAANGFQKIAGQYAMLAEQAIRRGDDRSASNYIRRGLRVDPYDDDLLALQVAMFKPEAGWADPAPVTPRQPPRKSITQPLQKSITQPPRKSITQPPQKSTTFFSRLSELMDKDQLGVKNDSIWHDEDDELH